MAFVERSSGTIVAAFAQRQAGNAEEWVADNHAELVAWRSSRVKTPADRARARINALDPLTRLMLEDIAALRGLTLGQLAQDYRGRL